MRISPALELTRFSIDSGFSAERRRSPVLLGDGNTLRGADTVRGAGRVGLKACLRAGTERDRRLSAGTAIAGTPVELLLNSHVCCARGVLRPQDVWPASKASKKGTSVVEITEVLVPGACTPFICLDGKRRPLRECGPGTGCYLIRWRTVLLKRRDANLSA